MQKSKESGKATLNISKIKDDLQGENSLACMYAIRSCVINSIHDEEVIQIIESLKDSVLVEWNTCKISDCAIAALDLMGIESYSGSCVQIKDLISTKFFTVNL